LAASTAASRETTIWERWADTCSSSK
jgi:hypothetical protein